MSRTAELTKLSAVELARRIRTGEITPLDVLDAHLAKIAELNPQLNALVTLDIEGAEYWLGDAGQNQANLLVARAARFAYPAVSNHPRHTLARHGMRSSSTRVSPCSSTSAFTVRPASFTRSARTNFDFAQHR